MSSSMTLRDILIALIAVLVWGLSFIVVKWGLADMPPLLFASFRFGAVALLAVALPRPALPNRALILYGLSWGTLQFGGLFLSISVGTPTGIASVLAQSQVFFTLLFAMVLRIERLRPFHALALTLSVIGLTCIGLSKGGHVPILGFTLSLIGAAGWAAGNLVIRALAAQKQRVDSIAFLAWASITPALTLLLLSLIWEGPMRLSQVFAAWSDRTTVAIAYQAIAPLLIGSLAWNGLLRRYPASTVAPFSLLVPILGLVAGAVAYDEHIIGSQILGSGLLLLALAINILGARSAAWQLRNVKNAHDKP